MNDYEVTFLVTYIIENAKDKWDAIAEAETMFSCDTHVEYDIDINPFHKEGEE